MAVSWPRWAPCSASVCGLHSASPLGQGSSRPQTLPLPCKDSQIKGFVCLSVLQMTRPEALPVTILFSQSGFFGTSLSLPTPAF